MNWLLLTYFLSFGSISCQEQIYNPAGGAIFSTPQPSFQTTLGVEATFADHVFVGGSTEAWMSPDGESTFNPFEGFYIFSAGLRGWGFEVGYRHECDHPIVSTFDYSFAAQGAHVNRDEFYVSYTGHLKVF